MKNTSRGRRTVLAALVATAAAAGVAVAAAPGAAASGDTPQWTETTVEAFRVTLPPWHSVKIPKASCPVGMNLVDRDYSPGRIVPKGVEVKEPGGIGVTINQASYWTYYEGGFGYRVYNGLSGSDIREATNWDPFSSHELVIDLHCTTNLENSSTTQFYER
ncbi:MAG TPA: hypothetical protein VFT68_15040 [Lapillicoccus sp.]|nr:hypothetical protein [Lapillicoccus sp.]